MQRDWESEAVALLLELTRYSFLVRDPEYEALVLRLVDQAEELCAAGFRHFGLSESLHHDGPVHSSVPSLVGLRLFVSNLVHGHVASDLGEQYWRELRKGLPALVGSWSV